MSFRGPGTWLAGLGVTALLGWSSLSFAAPGPTTNWVEAPTTHGSLDTATSAPLSGASQDNSPTDSGGERSWLAQSPPAEGILPTSQSSSGLDTTTAAGLLLLLALATAAVWMKRRKLAQTGVDQLEAQARLAVLSTTRLGPKSHAVSVTAGGRVMLLGVTEHSVTHLAWLDEVEGDVLLSRNATPSADLSTMEPDEFEAPEDDSLPDDYPGSALRAAQANAPSPPLANAHDLARFEKLLQGAGGSRSDRGTPRPPPSAASALANRTVDILGSTAGALADVTPLVSLRRKRQRRRAAAATPRPAAAGTTPAKGSTNPFEGQVAGLQAMRTRRSVNEP